MDNSNNRFPLYRSPQYRVISNRSASPMTAARSADGGRKPRETSRDRDQSNTSQEGESSLPEHFDLILDHIRCCILIVDENHRIVWQNQAASRLLCTGRVLCNREGQLRSAQASESATIKHFLDTVVQRDNNDTEESIVVLRGCDSRLLYEMVGYPASAGEDSPATDQLSTAIIFISDPEQHASIPTSVLKSLFGLTLCESRIARALLDGDSLEQYADKSHITLNTARTHLKSVFRKTDTSSQAGLVTLLSRLIPPVRFNEVEDHSN